MLSAKSLFQEILDNDESFRLFCSIAASGEAQGGWENGRIAALVPRVERDLAPKIARHGADEDKHGRIFNALLRKRGLEPVPVPAETDYTMLLETQRHRPGPRPAAPRRAADRARHRHLPRPQPGHRTAGRPSRCGLLRQVLRRPPRGRPGGQDDLRRRGQPPRLLPRGTAAAGPAGHGRHHPAHAARTAPSPRSVIYRDVSLAVMAHMGRILGWSEGEVRRPRRGHPRRVRATSGWRAGGGWSS